MSAAITLLESKPTSRDGNVRSFVTIRIGGITIRDAKIVQQNGQRAWLAMPDKQWTGQDGKTRYFAIIELSDTLKKTVNDTIIAAWEAQAGVR